MPRRKGPGGARPGAGRKPVAGEARSIVRTVKLTPGEAEAQDAAAARDGKPWPDWIRNAANVALGSPAVAPTRLDIEVDREAAARIIARVLGEHAALVTPQLAKAITELLVAAR